MEYVDGHVAMCHLSFATNRFICLPVFVGPFPLGSSSSPNLDLNVLIDSMLGK